jgi:hypothetical protein
LDGGDGRVGDMLLLLSLVREALFCSKEGAILTAWNWDAYSWFILSAPGNACRSRRGRRCQTTTLERECQLRRGGTSDVDNFFSSPYLVIVAEETVIICVGGYTYARSLAVFVNLSAVTQYLLVYAAPPICWAPIRPMRGTGRRPPKGRRITCLICNVPPTAQFNLSDRLCPIKHRVTGPPCTF